MFLKDDDELPRIRSGLYLDNVNGVVEHTINQENVTCESIKYTNHTSFNALEWFTVDMRKIYFSTISSQITNQLFLYESHFPSDHLSIKNNTIYKCCTIFNGKFRFQSRTVLIYIN
jgi:hypothetical protein